MTILSFIFEYFQYIYTVLAFGIMYFGFKSIQDKSYDYYTSILSLLIFTIVIIVIDIPFLAFIILMVLIAILFIKILIKKLSDKSHLG